MTGGERVTYRSVLANREFTAILLSQSLSVLGDQIARLALAYLVFNETGSAFAASATFGVSFLSYLLGGPVLSTLADRFPRLTIMVSSDVARAATVLLLAVRGLPLPVLYALIATLGLLAPAFDSARSATLPDILPGDAYVTGNALYNLCFQGVQVAGFLAGGALLSQVTVSQVLIVDAATFLISAGVLLFAVAFRRPVNFSTDSRGIWRDSLAGVRVVANEPALRQLLTFALLGVAVIAAPEALAVPIASEHGGGSLDAGILTASIPAGFVLASFAVLRVPAHRRLRLLAPMTALSAIPLLATPFAPSFFGVVALWIAAGLGSAMQIVASAAYVTAAPEHARARAYGIASTSIMATQGLAQLLGGSLASTVGGNRGASYAVAILAVLVLAVLLRLRARAPGISPFVGLVSPTPQGSSEIVR